MSFNTPVGTAEDMQCGKVVFTDIHIKNTRRQHGRRRLRPGQAVPERLQDQRDLAPGQGARVPVLRPVVVRAARHHRAAAAHRPAARRPGHAAAVGEQAARGAPAASAAPAAESGLIAARSPRARAHRRATRIEPQEGAANPALLIAAASARDTACRDGGDRADTYRGDRGGSLGPQPHPQLQQSPRERGESWSTATPIASSRSGRASRASPSRRMPRAPWPIPPSTPS